MSLFQAMMPKTAILDTSYNMKAKMKDLQAKAVKEALIDMLQTGFSVAGNGDRNTSFCVEERSLNKTAYIVALHNTLVQNHDLCSKYSCFRNVLCSTKTGTSGRSQTS